MSDPNPFAPPGAAVADIPAADRAPSFHGPGRIALLVLALIQIVASWRFAGTYLQLVNTGAASVLALLATVVVTIALYVGTLFVLRRRARGHISFLIAAVSLGLAVPLWDWRYPWSWLVAFGAMLGLFGAYLVMRARTPR